MGMMLWIVVTGLLVGVSLSLQVHSSTKRLLDRVSNLQNECIGLLQATGVNFSTEIERISDDKETVAQWLLEIAVFHRISVLAISLTVTYTMLNLLHGQTTDDSPIITYIISGGVALANATALVLPRVSHQRLIKANGMAEGIMIVAYAAKELIAERRKREQGVPKEE